MYASTGLTPAARTRTRISPAPGCGSATSSIFMTAGPPYSCTRIAFMGANAIMGTSMQQVRLHKTVGVKVGHVQVGGGAPVVVQSMTMTDTADARATAQQCIEL